MATFMDIHNGFSVTGEQLAEAIRDVDTENEEGAAASTARQRLRQGLLPRQGLSREAVMRIHERAGHPTPRSTRSPRRWRDATADRILGGPAPAIGVLGLGLAVGASAKADEVSAIRRSPRGTTGRPGRGGRLRAVLRLRRAAAGTMGQHYVKFPLAPTRPSTRRHSKRWSTSRRRFAAARRARGVRVGPQGGLAADGAGPCHLYVTAPNRYGIEPGFDERHFWLYKSNPAGAFADWNPNVSCQGTGDNGG